MNRPPAIQRIIRIPRPNQPHPQSPRQRCKSALPLLHQLHLRHQIRHPRRNRTHLSPKQQRQTQKRSMHIKRRQWPLKRSKRRNPRHPLNQPSQLRWMFHNHPPPALRHQRRIPHELQRVAQSLFRIKINRPPVEITPIPLRLRKLPRRNRPHPRHLPSPFIFRPTALVIPQQQPR
jgi:hypothetical protein